MRNGFGWTPQQWALVAVLLVVLGALPIIIYGSGFYFKNDFQVYFMPIYLEIGNQLAHGSFPFVTLKSWLGGNIIGEYQPGALNPLVLLLSTIAYLCLSDFSHAASLFATVHMAVLGLGVFAICGAMRCRLPAAVFGSVVAATNSWALYWGAVSWIPALTSLAWLAWAVAAIIRLRTDAAWLLPSSLLIAGTFASGWPHSDVALVICVGLLTFAQFVRSGSRRCIPLVLAAVGGALIALPSLLPLLEYFAFTVRPANFPARQWSVPIYAFLAVGFPFSAIQWSVFSGSWVSLIPIAYVNWATPFVMVKAWRDERQVFQDEYVRIFAAGAIIFLLLCVIPNIATLRWPFRFLPFFGLALSLMLARLLTAREQIGFVAAGWNRPVVVWSLVPTVVLGVAIISLVHPASAGTAALVEIPEAGLLAALAATVAALARRARFDWIIALTVSHIAIFAGILAVVAANPMLSPWKVPTSQNASLPNLPKEGNILFLYSLPIGFAESSTPSDKFLPVQTQQNQGPPSLLIGLAPLLLGYHAINGYSPMAPVSIQQFFSFELPGNSSPTHDPLPRLFTKEPQTGRSYAELMRIGSIVGEAGMWAARAEGEVPSGWERRVLDQEQDLLFERPQQPNLLPGTLSYLPEGITASLISFSDSREDYDVSVPPRYGGGPLVFARAWYPGYSFWFNGQRLQHQLIGDILPAVVLPSGTSGRLTIRYVPAGLIPGCWLAAVALLGLSLLEIRRRLRPRRYRRLD